MHILNTHTQTNTCIHTHTQYTSGSTSLPKGVVITHGALSHNCATIYIALRANTETIVVSWLPQYHDMGLIGSYLGVMYCGGSGVYISPISFIKSPPLWLQMASKYKGNAYPFIHVLSLYKNKMFAAGKFKK